MQRLELREEPVRLAVVPAGAALLGALVVLVHVLKLLLALLGAPIVPLLCQLPVNNRTKIDRSPLATTNNDKDLNYLPAAYQWRTS
jgi:hypothetical protein